MGEELGTTAANSRQLLHRAKAKVRPADRNIAAHAPEAHRELATRFAEAFRSGDASRLTQLLAADVTFVSDGGGKVAAARRPLAGRDKVLEFLVGLHRSAHATGLASQITGNIAEVNQEPSR